MIPARPGALARQFKSHLTRLAGRVDRALTPSTRTAHWIDRACLIGIAVIGAWIGSRYLFFGYGMVVDIALGAGLAVLLWLLGQLVVQLVSGLGGLLLRWLTASGLAAALALAMVLGIHPVFGFPLAFCLALALVLAGAGLRLTLGSPRRPIAGSSALVVALLFATVLSAWIAGLGQPEDPVADLVTQPQGDGGIYRQLLEPGPYQVGTLSYGSGDDRRREAFGPDIAWRSEPVDGRRMLGEPTGIRQRLRAWWWDFGLDELPLNGRVWYPANAEGPLPLILVVHGNHDMMRPSDVGYGWLGEHLASRGHIVVSVDQNFLNGSLFGGLNRENATRGWLLLEHLRAWREWQDDPRHRLHRLVDLDRVVLIGHSRGGEAVALAAALNDLPHFPEDARVRFDYGFGLRGIIAIAPVDGQFWPSDRATELHGVSYLTVHGGYDADVSLFLGDRQYARTNPDPAGRQYRAALYVHHANHGQFNTLWGNSDMFGPFQFALNRAVLLDGHAQRQLASLFFTAFIEDAVAGQQSSQYFELFCQPWRAGELLPTTLYASRCDDGRRVVLADFEEDWDLGTATWPGTQISTADMAWWAERDIGFRATRARRQQTGVQLGWHADPALEPHFVLALDQALALGEDAVLWLDLAQLDRDPPGAEPSDDKEPDASQEDGESEQTPLRPPVKMKVTLTDAMGRQQTRPLADFATLHPPLPVRHTRLRLADRRLYRSATEPVVQTVAVPISAFGRPFGPLQTIRLDFDSDHSGFITLERISLSGLQDQALALQPGEQ